jgi:shikimate kinase
MEDLAAVALGGFMGAGKTTVAAALARGPVIVDTDAVLVERYGSITRQFAVDGEAEFRRREAELVRSLRPAAAPIVATGGGVFADPALRAALRAAGYRLVTLRASIPLILSRIQGDPDRPLAQAGIEARLAARAAGYADVDLTVDVDGKSPAEIAGEISRWLRSA